MQFPIHELLDRYSIFMLKKEQIGGEDMQKACDEHAKALFEHNKKHGELNPNWLLKLYNINSEIWKLEADIRSAKITDLAEIGRRALKIREANKKRITIKNSIIEATGIGVKDIKINHVSE